MGGGQGRRVDTMLGPLLLFAALTAQDAGAESLESPRRPAGPPPAVARQQTTIRVDVEGRKLTGFVDVDTASRAISLRWSWQSDDAWQRDTQREEIDAWPTAALWYGDFLYVAAVDATGRTIVDRWQLGFSALAARTTYTADIESTRVFASGDGEEEELGAVAMLEPLAGASNRLFVQFAASADVCALDLEEGSLETLFTRAAIPALGREYARVQVAEHARFGYTYAYRGARGLLDETLVLLDADKDGVIESWRLFPRQEWIELLEELDAWGESFD